MAKDINGMLEHMNTGLGKLQDECPELIGAFVQMDQASYVEGELDRKTKELIGLSVALFARCEYCMALHVKQALEEGANREEILEAASVAVAFGGSPSMAYLSTTVMDALEEFDN